MFYLGICMICTYTPRVELSVLAINYTLEE